MKLILAPILLSVASALIPSFDLSTSKDVLLPRVMSPIAEVPEKPVREIPATRPEIVQEYPEFLAGLKSRSEGVDPARVWLPDKYNVEDLFKKTASGKSGVYIEGTTAVVQFGFKDFPKPAANLYLNQHYFKASNWRAGDDEHLGDAFQEQRREALAEVRRGGTTILGVLTSSSSRTVASEIKAVQAPQYAQMDIVELGFMTNLEKAATLLEKQYKLTSIKYRTSGGPLRKRRDERGPASITRTEHRSLHRYEPTAQLHERSGVLEQISPSPSNTNSTPDMTTQLELYLYALSAVQNNISELLFPFLDTIASKTNSNLVYDVLWIVFQDITGTSNSTGPFRFGWNRLGQLESQYSNSTNSTSKTSEDKEYLAVHQVLLDIYNYAWTNGTAAANKTGLLNDLNNLSSFLLSLNHSSLPPDLLQPTPDFDHNYFRTRNAGGDSSTTYFNFTLPQWE